MGKSGSTRSFGRAAFAGIAVVLLATSACSSSGTGGGTAADSEQGTSGGGTIKVGVLADLTGPASSSYRTTETGIKAYVDAVNAAGGVDGQKIEYVMADAASSSSGALTATQRLVQVDDVLAIISNTSFYFGASQYALKEGVPVLGIGLDGDEWNDKTYTNLFSVSGVTNINNSYAATGKLMKAMGVTNCAGIGYTEPPSASKAVSAAMNSCQAAGLKAGYVKNLQFGSTDVGPVALGMKSAGVNGVYMATVPSTGFALATALKQQGVQLKAVLLATGYGADLLSDPAGVRAAQGDLFSSTGEPVEMHTPATQRLSKNLAAVGFTGTPTFAIQISYIAMAAFVQGLKAAGADPSRAQYIAALRKVKGFDADGLLAPLKVNFSDYSPSQQCVWPVRLQGDKFVPVKGMPFCGGLVG